LYGADLWDCIADEAIKAGERVKVVSVEGSILKIAKTGGHS
jgi:membrane-bound ClpP family serine protease